MSISRPPIAYALLRDVAAAFMLLTRIPVPWQGFSKEQPDLTRAVWAYPIVGGIVGGVGAVVLWLAQYMGLSPQVGALLSIAALVLTTGAFHEDGLADVADGFGGGRQRDQKLEIMRDSRIGTYGTLAIALSVGLRWAAIASLETDVACMALVATGSVSRAAIVIAPWLLSPARPDGMGQAAGKPAMLFGVAALVIGAVTAVLTLGPSVALPVGLAGIAGTVIMALIAWRQIGGYTGDVLGSAQQLSELFALLVIASLLAQSL